MSRTVLKVLVLVSLLWATGIGLYAWQVRQRQADMMAMVTFDNCLVRTKDIAHCYVVRDQAISVSNSGFPIGNVAMLIGVPLLLLWGIAAVVARRSRRSLVTSLPN